MTHIRGSQSAFDCGGGPVSSSRTGCYRNQLLNSVGVDETFPQHIAMIGARNEILHQNDLSSNGESAEAEVNSPEFEVIPGVTFHGRADFLFGHKVQELKSVTSKKTYARVFNKSEPKTENVAQLLAYMVGHRKDMGELIYSFFVDGARKEQKTFHVQIMDESGLVQVDGYNYEFTVPDLVRHQQYSALALRDNLVLGRPSGWDKQWESPCAFCCFRHACLEYDLGGYSTEDFLGLAKKEISEKENK